MLQIVKQNLIYVAIFSFLFIYLLIRAIWVPAYHDELNTFFTYVQTGRFQPFYSVIDQNNHVLNTAFSHVFFLVFGESLFVLRLANVLSFIVFMFYVWKISKSFSISFLGYAFFVTMGMSMYLFSFFSLSRGYGMSIAFFTASVYYLLEYRKCFSPRNIIIGLFAASCATWAYLGMMIPVLVLSSLFFLLLLYSIFTDKKFSKWFYVFPGIIVLFGMPMYYAIKYSFYIRTQGTIYGSIDHNFVKAVIFNLTDEFAGTTNSISGKLFLLFMVIIMLASLVGVLRKKLFTNSTMLSILLLLGTIIGTIILNIVVKVDYPTSRMATYFYVLFCIPLYVAIDESGFKMARVGGYLVSLVIVVQFAFTFNVSYAPCWRYETLPHNITKRIASEFAGSAVLPTLSTYDILLREFNEFDYKNGGKLNYPQVKDFPGKVADYILANDFAKNHIFTNYDTIEYDHSTRCYLLKRKEFVKWEVTQNFDTAFMESNGEFIGLFENILAENYINYPFCYEVSFDIQSDKFPLTLALTCDVWDESNKSLVMSTMPLQYIKADVKSKQRIHRRMYIENIPDKAKILKFYFYNKNYSPVKISNLTLKLMKSRVKYSDL